MTYDIIEKKYIERPDHNTRMKAGQLIAAYREGLPVARQVQLQRQVPGSLGTPGGKGIAGDDEKLAEMGAVIEVESDVQETGQSSTTGFSLARRPIKPTFNKSNLK